MNLRREEVNHLTHQEKQNSGGGNDEDMQFRMRVSACLMNFSSSFERMTTNWISNAALVTDDSPIFQCHAIWSNTGQRSCFFPTQTQGPEDGGMFLRKGAHQWEAETSSYLWDGGTSQTSRSDTKGRGAACHCWMSRNPPKQCELALLSSSRSQSLAMETDLQRMLEP